MPICSGRGERIGFVTSARQTGEVTGRHRIVHPVMRVWDSTPRNKIDMLSGRWEGASEFDLSWNELLYPRDGIEKLIAIIEPP